MSTKENLPKIKDVLDEIKAIYNNNGGYIKESGYKQTIFEKLFKALGYINDYSRSVEEIRFEVPDGNNKFIDIVVGNDIIVEVKGSHISIDNVDFLDQAFGYNSYVGKRLVVVTNFKRMKIFEVGRNNLLADLDLLNYNNQTIKELYRYFNPFSLGNKEVFTDFYYNYYNKFIGSYYRLKEFEKELTCEHKEYLLIEDVELIRDCFEKARYSYSFLQTILKTPEINKLLTIHKKYIEIADFLFTDILNKMAHGYYKVFYIKPEEIEAYYSELENIRKDLEKIKFINEKNFK